MDSKSISLKAGKSPVGPNGEDPVKLRAQIAETRNEMSETIEELHGRLNPTVFKEQALEQFHEATETVKAELKARFEEAKATIRADLIEAKAAIKSDVLDEVNAVKARLNDEMVHAKTAMRDATIGKVRNMMQNAQDRVRDAGRVAVDNPIPAVLASVGLAWLFVASRRKRRALREGTRVGPVEHDDDTAMPGADTRARIRDVAQETGQKVADATHDAASAVSRFAHNAKGAVSDVAHRTQEATVEISHKAERQARRLGRRSRELYRANPIAVGAGLLAIGTVAGLAIPRTRAEDQWVGKARDDAMGKARQLAHQAFEKAGEVVERVGSGDEADEARNASSGGQDPTTPSGRFPGSNVRRG